MKIIQLNINLNFANMNDLTKNILAEQSQMKVTLNGGKFELDDATIPFQIGFDKSIADKNPSHILVIDITKNPFVNEVDENERRRDNDSKSERIIFSLEPVNYLQLTKPGIHHLIFILFRRLDNNYQKYFLEKCSRSNYRNDLYLSSIELGSLDYQICYTEVVVDVPELFFASKPKTGIKKTIWSWINFWYEFDPIDQCEYRRRAIWAFTIKPILWLIGFMLRFFCAIVLNLFSLVIRILALSVGFQPVSFFPNTADLWWRFLILYPSKNYCDVFDWDYWFERRDGDDNLNDKNFHSEKIMEIGKLRFYAPVTLFGLFFYGFLFWILYHFVISKYLSNDNLTLINNITSLSGAVIIAACISYAFPFLTLQTIKKDEVWQKKWAKNVRGKIKIAIRIFITIFGFSLGTFLATQVSTNTASHTVEVSYIYIIGIILSGMIIFGAWLLVNRLLWPAFIKMTKKIIIPKVKLRKLVEKKSHHVKMTKEQLHQEWLYKSFDINNLPEKVELKTMPEPSTPIHRFTISFWSLKAKVCKPYARK